MVLPFQNIPGPEALQVFRIKDYLNEGSFAPHRHHFYMLLWIVDGADGLHQIDFEDYELADNRVFPVAEGRVHRIIRPAADGWMISFRENVFHALQQGSGGIDAAELFHWPYVDLDAEEAENFAFLWKLFLKTMGKNAGDPMLINQLRVLFGCLLNCTDQRKRLSVHGGHYPVLQQLKRLINDYYKVRQDPDFYADILAVPLWKLNSWCRESLGNSVSGLLLERLVLEAKALLATTSLSVKEVTFELGMDDSSNFAKVFRRFTGVSPADYRSQIYRSS
ncbi:helix-turn-helix transcriptional regulator [Mucilaginibacter sp. CAU 1740]|uniref:AraC family transcriptional regulator n=1 Tax=Mucilaginibacter sp. CAU 1740 TaxID=3140365 RepID=UPI00325BE14F